MEIKGLDPEVVEIVAAMNKFPGICTVESCWGHEHTPIHIWFVADSLEALPPLLYWIDS